MGRSKERSAECEREGREPALVLTCFGPLCVRVAGFPLPRPRSRRAAWLLVLLALQRGRAVERGWIAATLWPECAATPALYNLRRNLADLRRALGAEASRLRAPTPRSLALDLEGADVDVLRFDAAVARGDADSLATAVALYRGPLLDGCSEAWVVGEREQREQRLLEALETLAAHHRARNDASAAARYLRRAITVDPFREGAQRALMQTLADSGNLPAAQHLYRELRLHLHRELNAAPDPETTALFHHLVRGAGAPAARGGSERPAPRAARRATTVPRPPTALIGRERDVEAIRDLLESEAARLITITGPAGVGKTRLALEVARRADGVEEVAFVDLAPIRDPGQVIPTVARVLGIRESAERALAQSVQIWMRERSLLLVLDNFEQVLAAATEIAALLAACDGPRVLVTSRAPLRLRGEHEYLLPPLPERESVALFAARTRAFRPEFVLNEENTPAIERICHRLDRLPLAIELAAARTRLFAPDALLARLEGRLSLLADGPRDLPVRQQTLAGAIGWSYDLLSKAEKRLFRHLAVFAGGFTLRAAETVCAATPEGIAALVEQSLLQRAEPDDPEPRFRMLETVHEFARERLDADPEARTVRDRHAEQFLALADELERTSLGPGREQLFARLDQEIENLRAALAWSLDVATAAREVDAGRVGPRLAGTLVSFWHFRGHWTEGTEWLRRFLALPAAAEHVGERAQLLFGIAVLQWNHSLSHQAEGWCEEAITLFRRVSDRRGMARALGLLGFIANMADRHERASALLEESHALWRDLDDPVGLVGILNERGGQAYRLGEPEAARRYLEEAVAICHRFGERRALLSPLTNLAMVAEYRDEAETVHRLQTECLMVAREVGSTLFIARSLERLGSMAYSRGDLATARASWEEALMAARQQEHVPLVMMMLNGMGWIACSEGELTAARAHHQEAVDIAREAESRSPILARHVDIALRGLARVALAEGNVTEARKLAQETLRSSLQSDPPEAHPNFRSSRSAAVRLPTLAAVAWAANDALRAVRLLGATESLLGVGPIRLPGPEAEECERLLATLRTAMGDKEFATAWAEGQAMSREEAIRFALEETP